MTANASAVTAAVGVAAEHQLPISDAVVVAAAVEAGCSVLRSEDFQHGFSWRGVTVVNPFAAATHTRLARMLHRSIRG